jgi:hypothetical protein
MAVVRVVEFGMGLPLGKSYPKEHTPSGRQSVVKVPSSTESAEAPAPQGAKSENTGSI